MNAPLRNSCFTRTTPSRSLRACVDEACQRVAPTWPLDRLIAVNPWWGFIDRPITNAAAELTALNNTRPFMPYSYYRQAWRNGEFGRRHVEAAIAASQETDTADELISALENDESASGWRLQLVSQAVDSDRDLRVAPAWSDFVIQQISQHCAAHFDQMQARWSSQRATGNRLYAAWIEHTVRDHGPRLLFRDRSFTARAKMMPREAFAMIERALNDLGVPHDVWTDYCTALLLDINGWSAWCAYLGWQGRLAGQQDDHLHELLATRIAWEWLLFTHDTTASWISRWRAQWPEYHAHVRGFVEAQRRSWLLQAALERAYQETLGAGLQSAPPFFRDARPAAHAVFCIDVRSERFRRALESVAPDIATRGFAGFFGLPLGYTPLGTCGVRPQLPGLLAPSLHATDGGSADAMYAAQVRRPAALAWRDRWHQWRSSATSAFTFVESLGLLYAGKLVERTFGRIHIRDGGQAGLSASQGNQLRPSLLVDGSVDVARLCDVAAGALDAMGLTSDFAPIVLLVGHGSRSANNPLAASLDCGACGGATGEVNARVLAELLNDARIRSGLSERGIRIPPDTHFVAALHDTTTDEVTLHDLADVPPRRAAEVDRLSKLLRRAGDRVRAERAHALGLAPAGDASKLLERMQRRASNWAEVRPEWGLAGNAALIIAPRRRSRHLNLDGRVFLHDYDCRSDHSGARLELIMTAPMVVAHWINMQYYASTVDNARYGSGNKVLHNVVGGRIGVFEGNGGDLRIGLPLQSLHDGSKWRHTPLRLSVYIEAAKIKVEAVLRKHETVRHLVQHEWLHLFCIDPASGVVRRYQHGEWIIDTIDTAAERHAAA